LTEITKIASTMRAAGAAAFAGLVMLAASSCTKTSDGSIEPIIPISMPSYSPGNIWKREQPKPQALPAAPSRPQIDKPRFRPRARQIRAANARVPKFSIATTPLFKPAPPTAPQAQLACKNVTSGTGRVKVVCE
jgi:hypothetical protein